MNFQPKKTLPAEWIRQDAILLCWPHQSMDWQPVLDEVEPAFIEMARHISQQQKLIIIAHDQAHQDHIEQLLLTTVAHIDAIIWLQHKNDDTWCRDFGPVTILENSEPVALDFQFNGWGNKFKSDADNAVNKQLLQDGILGCPLIHQSLVLEGGSIESDGIGTLLTTTDCLLNDQRNPELDQQQIEQQLKQLLGCDRVLWLHHGYLEGDDTDSHIDNLARFCSTDTIAYASCDDVNDIHYQPLKAMEAELQTFRTADGQAYKLIPLNIPKPIYDDGDRLPASYANFLITNHLVLMPTYNDDHDQLNLEKLQAIFTDRQVIGIPCQSVVKQHGSVHCLTMQLPEHTLSASENIK